MKITYIHQYFSNLEMPGSTRSYEMARRLVTLGHEVNMIATYRKNDIETESWFTTIEEGITVHWLPLPYTNKLGITARIKAFIRFAYKSAFRAASLDTDIVFASSTPLTIALPAVYTSWKKKVPMVFEVRDLWPDIPIAVGVLKDPFTKFIARKLESFAYSKAAHIIALSPTMKSEIIKKGIPASKIGMIPNASDISSFNNLNNPEKQFRKIYPMLGDRPFVLYAGALGSVNGVDYLAQIAAEMVKIDSDICFVVFGEGKEKENILNIAKKLGVLNRNFFMFERITKGEIPMIFASCALSTSFVIDLQAMWANSANKFFDTLAAGKPIVINHRGWQADLIEKYDCGLVLQPSNPPDSAVIIRELIRNEERLILTGRNARSLAESQFDRDKLVAQLEKILVNTVAKEN